MNPAYRHWVLWGAVLFLVWQGGNVVALDLELDQAVDMALKSNEKYLSALQDKRKAEGEVRQARAGALPSLKLDGRYTRNFELPEIIFAGQSFKIGTADNYSLAFNLDQTLFDGGNVYYAMRIAQSYDRYSAEGVKAARQEVIYESQQAFFGAILAQEYVNVARHEVKQAEENLGVVTSQYNQGLVSEFDKLRAEVELGNLLPVLTRAENDARLAINNLKYQIGYEGEEELVPKFTFEIADTIPTPEMESSLRLALSARPDYVGQKYLIEAYKKAIGIAGSGRLPSLYFSAALEWTAALDDKLPGGDDWVRSASATLSLGFPIFDGFRTSGAVKKAKADYVKASLLRAQIEDGIRLEVEEAIASIAEAKKRLSWGRKTIALAEEGLRVADVRYKGGIGLQLEVLSARAALTKAKTNYLQAIYDYQISLAKYDRAIGKDRPGEKE